MPFRNLHTKQYQAVAFRYLLALTVVAALVFCLLNFYKERYFLSLFQCAISICSLVVLIALLKGKLDKRLNVVCRLYLALLYVCMILVLALLKNMQVTMYSFVFVIPPLSYLLLGQRWGFIYTIIFANGALAAYLLNFSKTGYLFDIGVAGNLLVCLITVWSFSHLYEKAQDKAQNVLVELASKDALTGLLNRAVLDLILAKDLDYSLEHKGTLSIAVINLDWFKIVNDNYGYQVGDEILKSVSGIIQVHIRNSDSLFRIGGKEFAISFPNTMPRQAAQVVEKIRAEIEQTTFKFDENIISISVSAGVAECNSRYCATENILKKASKHMHIAKQMGRNQVIMES